MTVPAALHAHERPPMDSPVPLHESAERVSGAWRVQKATDQRFDRAQLMAEPALRNAPRAAE
jgi:hypothetical protein